MSLVVASTPAQVQKIREVRAMIDATGRAIDLIAPIGRGQEPLHRPGQPGAK